MWYILLDAGKVCSGVLHPCYITIAFRVSLKDYFPETNIGYDSESIYLQLYIGKVGIAKIDK